MALTSPSSSEPLPPLTPLHRSTSTPAPDPASDDDGCRQLTRTELEHRLRIQDLQHQVATGELLHRLAVQTLQHQVDLQTLQQQRDMQIRPAPAPAVDGQ